MHRCEKTNHVRLQTVQGRIPVLGTASKCDLPYCRILTNHTVSYRIPQTRVERWIHELALRNTMTRAHRQAWAWQVIYRSEGWVDSEAMLVRLCRMSGAD